MFTCTTPASFQFLVFHIHTRSGNRTRRLLTGIPYELRLSFVARSVLRYEVGVQVYEAVCRTSSPFRSSLFAPLSLQMPVSLAPLLLLLLLLLLIRVCDFLFADVEHVVELSQALAVGDQHPDQAQDSSARCQQTRGTQTRNSRA